MTTAPVGKTVQETEIVGPLCEAISDAGYRVGSLELLRVGNNYIFADRSMGNVFRVPVEPVDKDELTQRNRLIIDLVSAGAPILPPRQREPFQLSTGDLATVWPLGEAADPEPAATLAPILASLHQQVSPADLGVWEGFGRGWRRIELARSRGVPDGLVGPVAERLQHLEATFPVWSTGTVVHGDPHTGNLVKMGDRHLLIDLDDLAVGCPEIDLAPLRTSYSRFSGVPGTWELFLDSYGGPIDAELLEWFVELRQLTMIAWLFTLWGLRSESRAEAQHRVSTLDNPAALWSAL